jgi:hypothetical protein
MADEIKKDAKENVDEIVIPQEVVDVPPEGYTQHEWSMLSTEDKEGIKDMLKHPNGEDDVEKLEEVDENVLKEIVDADEIKPIEDVKKEDEEIKPEVMVEVDEVSDVDLLSFRPTITSEGISNWLSSQTDVVKEHFTVKVPDKMMSEYNESLKEVKAKFENDEISRDEYDDKRDELKEKINDFKASERERIRDELRDAIIWDKEQMTFWKARNEYLGEKKDDGTFVKTTKSAMLMSALQTAISQIDDGTLSGMQVLVKADKMVKETLGLSKPKEVKDEKIEVKDKKKTPAEVSKEKPKVKLPDESLGDVPEAGKNVVGDPWEAIDRMPDKQREEWLKKQPQKVVDAYANAR